MAERNTRARDLAEDRLATASSALTVRILEGADFGADAARGSGLRGLQDRVATLGGTLAVVSPEGGGTRLTATIPLAPWRTARENVRLPIQVGRRSLSRMIDVRAD